MSFQQHKTGYCACCVSNESHVRKVPDGIYWILDICTLSSLETFRIGPWFCLECNTEQLYLPLIKSPRAIENIRLAKEDANPQLRSVGNFLRSEQSLVQRRRRTLRYSEKFRDDMVLRLLNGNTTLAQVRRDHNVTEQDIKDWLTDMRGRHSDRLAEFDQLVAQSSLSNRNIRIESRADHFDQHDVVEGKIRAK